jgi:hypothetical protein
MLKRSVLSGLIVGLLTSLAALYTISTTFAAEYIPDWQNPPPAVHRSLLLASLAATATFLGLGIIATALLVRPRSHKAALKYGAITGISFAFSFQILILSPAEGITRARGILQRDPTSGLPPASQLNEHASHLLGAALNNIALPFILCAGGGALVMAGLFSISHLLKHKHLPDYHALDPPHTPPNLLHLVHSQFPLWRRISGMLHWPDPTESTWRAGLIGGTLLGAFLGLQALTLAGSVLGEESDHELYFLAGTDLQRLSGWLTWLTPLVFFFGAILILALQRHPYSRYWSRVWACTIAGGAAGAAFQIVFLNHLLRVNVPLLRLVVATGEHALDPEQIQHLPLITGFAFFAAPLFTFPFIVISGLLVGFLQGTVYAWLVPLVPGFRRPVDVGRRTYRHISRAPDTTLPALYELFRQESEALEVVAHLALRARTKKDPAVAQTAAAYHTLATHPEATDEATQALAETLEAHPNWRWRAEISELYRVLRTALGAREVAHVAIIAPPPEERTSSLPKPLARTLDYLAAIIRTLKKYERVDDLGGQILFLNNALDAISRAQDYVRHEMHDPATQRTPYPEQNVMQQILARWQTIVLNTIRSLRGRAELTATLETRRLPYNDTLNLQVRVVNVGLNVAEDVQVQLAPDPAYQVTPGHDTREIEILLPGDGRSLEFSLAPTNPPDGGGDLRVIFDVHYNDSVDPQQKFQLADSIAFLDRLKPFRRIFPIPYITGTPLQTGDMFVGRGEILQFVREHLLGAYQNNVIVLHGQRRTGKTSILYQLQRTLQDSHVCVLVDMQGKAARGLVDFLYSLADDITYALEDLDIIVELPEREEFQESPEFFFRSRFLRQVANRLDQRNLLLMLDEFEELQARVESGMLEPNIFPYLRNLMQHEQKVDFVFAGTHKLEDLIAAYWSILFNIATYKKISFLAEGEVTQLITQPVAPFGLEYDPLAVRRIHTVTAGQPYFVQLVCHELVAYHNESERNYLTTYDVETVLKTIIERGEAHFKYIWAGATPQERWVLLGAAEHLAHAETITFAELAAWLRQQETDLDAAHLPDVLATLEQRDILERTSPASRRFRFKIDLVRRWIIANRQLRDTIGT